MRREDFIKFLNEFQDRAAPLIRRIPNDIDVWLDGIGFFTAPASTKYHGAYEGGLYDHSLAVTKRLIEMTDKLDLEWTHPESPFIVGMFHDLCKCDQYKWIDESFNTPTADEHGVIHMKSVPGGHYEYNEKLLLKGHGDKSVMLLSQVMPLTEEEILCIRYHMGAYNKEDWDGFDMAIRKYPTVLYTHTSDMAASKIDGI